MFSDQTIPYTTSPPWDWLITFRYLIRRLKSAPPPKYLLYLKYTILNFTSTVTRREACSKNIYTDNNKWNCFILMKDQNASFKNSLFFQKMYCSTSPNTTVVRKKKLVHVIKEQAVLSGSKSWRNIIIIFSVATVFQQHYVESPSTIFYSHFEGIPLLF